MEAKTCEAKRHGCKSESLFMSLVASRVIHKFEGVGMKTYIATTPIQGASPSGMSFIETSKEHADMLNKIAMEIWVDMTNAGKSLQETVATIYLSGLVHATKIGDRAFIGDKHE